MCSRRGPAGRVPHHGDGVVRELWRGQRSWRRGPGKSGAPFSDAGARAVTNVGARSRSFRDRGAGDALADTDTNADADTDARAGADSCRSAHPDWPSADQC